MSCTKLYEGHHRQHRESIPLLKIRHLWDHSCLFSCLAGKFSTSHYDWQEDFEAGFFFTLHPCLSLRTCLSTISGVQCLLSVSNNDEDDLPVERNCISSNNSPLSSLVWCHWSKESQEIRCPSQKSRNCPRRIRVVHCYDWRHSKPHTWHINYIRPMLVQIRYSDKTIWRKTL